jgi:hypothetical protein
VFGLEPVDDAVGDQFPAVRFAHHAHQLVDDVVEQGLVASIGGQRLQQRRC